MRWDSLTSKIKSYFRKEKHANVPVKKEAGRRQEVFLEGVGMDRAEEIRRAVLLSPWSISSARPDVRKGEDGNAGVLVTFTAIGTQGGELITQMLVQQYGQHE